MLDQNRKYKVDICIITYQRPDGLSRLIEGLERLLFQKHPNIDLYITVVDNDPLGSSRSVVNRYNAKLKWPLKYIVEPVRGIPQARNTAIRSARQDTNFIVFVDDDEVPQPQWLDELIAVQQRTNADIVTGPVIPYFPQMPPSWMIKGKYFERRMHADAEQIGYSRTGNVLITKLVVDSIKPPFDESLALTGGSDTVFFSKAQLLGYNIYWAANAVVVEWQPQSRLNLSWILKRSMRTAYTELFVDFLKRKNTEARILRGILGLIRIIYGSLILLPSLLVGIFIGRHIMIEPLRIMYRGVGMILASWGISYQEYKKIHIP